MSSTVIRNWTDFLLYYSVTITVLGTIGNFLTFFICLRKSLRKVPTFIFLAFMSLTDSCSLYFWNLSNFFMSILQSILFDLNIWACRIPSFLQMFFSQSSSYLLIALALERYLSVKVINWRTSFFNSKRATIMSSLIVTFFFLLNFHINFTLPFDRPVNGSLGGLCYSSSIYRTWRMLHTYVYSMIPFAILLIINCMLIYEVVFASRIKTDKNALKSRSMSISVIIHTMTFIILTGPMAIIGGYFANTLMFTEIGRAVLFNNASMAFTFHGSNFLILLLTNKRFFKEVKTILTEIRCIKVKQQQKQQLTAGTQTQTKF